MTTQATETLNPQQAWGRIYGLIDKLTPGGLRPSMINNASITPAQFFPVLHQNIIYSLKGEDDRRMTELMSLLGPDSTKTNYKAGEQADFLMAFTQEKHGYGESQCHVP